MSQKELLVTESETLELSDDPRSWHRVVKSLCTRIQAAPIRSLQDAGATFEVLGVLEQVQAWCAKRAGMEDDA
jgi:hypothetical protein